MLKQGVLIGDPAYALFQHEGYASYREAYDWMVEQYEKRIGISMNGTYPVWCSDVFPKAHRYIDSGEQGVVLTVELPDEEVLSSELYYWDIVTMKGYVGIEDSNIGLTVEAQRESWERIFDRDWCQAHAMPVRRPEYQHVIHQIELHQVRAVTPFQGLGDSWGDQIRGYSWHLSYHLGLKQSIPFRLDTQMDKS